jgi:hypothetical protein
MYIWEHIKWIILSLIIGFIASLIITQVASWQLQSYENGQAMILNAKQACNGHLIFFTPEQDSKHPLIVCSQK